ncbi:MAG: glycosyltransferase family 39 protein [Candidatus Krumholzibacteriota bacterium]|nr:glycosyltransferase family 39 protein [Candidatus Krumholzibacteriota bacterium]
MREKIISRVRSGCLSFWDRHLKSNLAADWDILLVIFFLALALRLYFALAFNVQYAANDNARYDLFSTGGGINAARAPLYPHLLRLTHALFGAGYPRAVFIFQGILSALAAVLIYLPAKRLCDRTVALVTAALCALSPNFILYCLALTPGSVVIFLGILLLALASLEIGDKFKGAVSGVLLGLGILTEPVLIFLLPGMIFTLKKKLFFLVLLLAVLAPWTIRNSVIDSRPVPVYRIEAYRFNFDKYYRSEVLGAWNTASGLYNNAAIILNKGWETPDSMAQDDPRRNSNYTAAYTYTLISLLGFIGMAKYYRRDHRPLVLPLLVYIVLLIFLTIFELRFRMLLEPVLILYTSMIICRRKAPAFSPSDRRR